MSCYALALLLSRSVFSFQCASDPPDLHSFPTRRSSDLLMSEVQARRMGKSLKNSPESVALMSRAMEGGGGEYPVFESDRKSTRLNSSHRCISYAVFCLKKKKKKRRITRNNLAKLKHQGY